MKSSSWLKEEKGDLDCALIMCPGWGVSQPPVGISYLKGFLEKYAVSVRCFDLSVEFYKTFPEKRYWDLNYPEYFIESHKFAKYILPRWTSFADIYVKKILSHNPKLIGFSLFMSNINTSLLLAKQLKKYRPHLLILGGGAEVPRIKKVVGDKANCFSPVNENIFDDFDLLINGEGEEVLLEIFSLLERKRDFYDIDGIFYMDSNRVVVNNSRKLIDNLDILSPPDYSDFDLKNYTKEVLPLVTSRGCINHCTFCADSPLWKKYRYRSTEKVIEEIKFLINKYGVNQFEITDSTFNGNLKRVEEICDLIMRVGLDVRWSAKVTLRKEMSDALLNKMKKSGCCSLAYGVESGSQRVLRDMRKNIDLKEAKRIIRETYKAGIQVNCFFIIGYPTETEEDFKMTLDFIKENAEFIHRFDQITGCPIEEDSYLGLNLDKYGIIFKEDGWHNKEVTPRIRENRLRRFRELARELHKHYQCEVQL